MAKKNLQFCMFCCIPSHLCAVIVKARAQTTDFAAFKLVLLKSSIKSQGSKGFTRCTFHWIICQHFVPIVPICRCLITHNVGRNEGAKVHQWGKLASEFYELYRAVGTPSKTCETHKTSSRLRCGQVMSNLSTLKKVPGFLFANQSGRKEQTLKMLPDSVDQVAFRGDVEGISCKDLAKIQVAQSSAGTTIR